MRIVLIQTSYQIVKLKEKNLSHDDNNTTSAVVDNISIRSLEIEHGHNLYESIHAITEQMSGTEKKLSMSTPIRLPQATDVDNYEENQTVLNIKENTDNECSDMKINVACEKVLTLPESSNTESIALENETDYNFVKLDDMRFPENEKDKETENSQINQISNGHVEMIRIVEDNPTDYESNDRTMDQTSGTRKIFTRSTQTMIFECTGKDEFKDIEMAANINENKESEGTDVRIIFECERILKKVNSRKIKNNSLKKKTDSSFEDIKIIDIPKVIEDEGDNSTKINDSKSGDTCMINNEQHNLKNFLVDSSNTSHETGETFFTSTASGEECEKNLGNFSYFEKHFQKNDSTFFNELTSSSFCNVKTSTDIIPIAKSPISIPTIDLVPVVSESRHKIYTFSTVLEKATGIKYTSKLMPLSKSLENLHYEKTSTENIHNKSLKKTTSMNELLLSSNCLLAPSKHLSTAEMENKMNCDNAQETTTRKTKEDEKKITPLSINLKTHENKISSKETNIMMEKYKCLVCEKEFISFSEYHQHIFENHKLKPKEEINSLNITKDIDEDRKVSEFNMNLKSELKKKECDDSSMDLNLQFTTNDNSMETKSNQSLMTTSTNNNSSNHQESTGNGKNKSFYCRYCDKELTVANAFMQHLFSKHHVCFCSLSVQMVSGNHVVFPPETVLISKVPIREKTERKYSCKKCSKKIGQNQNLLGIEQHLNKDHNICFCELNMDDFISH